MCSVNMYSNTSYCYCKMSGFKTIAINNNNISLLQTHGPYTYKKNVKHI